ncbi:putative late blight resistance protein homolog R1A-10 isoform X2 [Salvia hispanica]|uniref:putative late blight resistance protein homolog R1A-10 isoform X2 n=1 Tax=Salvia hispanica TaxID=49212 RepID=UPI002009846A|nr:putative late blight resistance protein homolog R1A-10 isoform X2 [Salvia hispanica]
MTAYGAVNSLRNTINDILYCSRFSLVGRSQEIMQVVYKKLEPLPEILESLDKTRPSKSRKKVNALDGRIRDVIWKFEDSLESLLTQQIPSQLESLPEIVPVDLQNLLYDVNILIHAIEGMKKDYIYEVKNMPRDKPISTEIGFQGTNSKMIGLSVQFQKLKTGLLQRNIGWNHVYGLYGTAGIGKTTLAMQIYQDEEIQSKYECRAWLTVGRVHQPIGQISRGIVAQLCGTTQGDEEIGDYLKKQLYGKNSLIVLDDVNHLPYIEMGCTNVLFTDRHRKWIGDYLSGRSLYEVQILNEEEGMELLCEKVFGDEICPPQLHKLATKIAKLCEGLPLLILTVADILSKSEHNRDPVYWNEVAERRNSVFTDAYNEISKASRPYDVSGKVRHHIFYLQFKIRHCSIMSFSCFTLF